MRTAENNAPGSRRLSSTPQSHDPDNGSATIALPRGQLHGSRCEVAKPISGQGQLRILDEYSTRSCLGGRARAVADAVRSTPTQCEAGKWARRFIAATSVHVIRVVERLARRIRCA